MLIFIVKLTLIWWIRQILKLASNTSRRSYANFYCCFSLDIFVKIYGTILSTTEALIQTNRSEANEQKTFQRIVRTILKYRFLKDRIERRRKQTETTNKCLNEFQQDYGVHLVNTNRFRIPNLKLESVQSFFKRSILNAIGFVKLGKMK